MKAQNQPETQAAKLGSRPTESGGRKPWIKKTPVEVVLEQINKQEQKVQAMEAELPRDKRELQKLSKAKEVLEPSNTKRSSAVARSLFSSLTLSIDDDTHSNTKPDCRAAGLPRTFRRAHHRVS